MSKVYYYTHQGQPQGPVAADEVQALVQSGKLLPTDQFWKAGMPEFRPMGELHAYLAAPASLPASSSMEVPAPHPPFPQATPPVAAVAPAASVGSDAGGTRPNATPVDSPVAAVTWGQRAQRCLAEIQKTTVLTAAHLADVARCGGQRWQVRKAQRQVFDSQVALGKRCYELGSGEAAQRERIHATEERIRSLQAAKTTTRSTEKELRGEYARLAEEQLAQPEKAAIPPLAEAEHRAALAAKEALQTQQLAAEQAVAAVRGTASTQRGRLGAGYGAAALVLLVSLWAVGATLTPNSETSTPIGPPVFGPPLVGAPKVGAPNEEEPADPAPSDPVAPYVPPTYVTPAPQPCYHCNRTGQADCQACFGRGTRTCFSCNGSGRAINFSNANVPLRCQQCNATGQQDCNLCQYGKVQCPICFGRGQR